jgi:hypothetical protein
MVTGRCIHNPFKKISGIFQTALKTLCDSSASVNVVKSDRQIHFPPFRLDRLSGRVCRGDETIAIRPKAFAVLTYLLERRGKLATKDELLDACWPEMAVSDTVLSGYRFIGEITEDKGTRGQGDKETGGQGEIETGRQGDKETGDKEK